MAGEVKEGDVVRLKSGSPAMTVEKIGESENKRCAWCVWFHDTERKSGVFHLTTLEHDE